MSGSTRAFGIIILALLLLSRIPLAAEYFDGDNVNLAFGLERFDPHQNQPQPPGYPFLVGFARIVNLAFHDVNKTFRLLAVVCSALCLLVVAILGRRMFNPRAARIATLLLLVNPAFWFSGLEGPLRLPLALFSMIVAYCSWRAWNGERPYVIWGALALGLGSGFRPDLLMFLSPLWFVSAYIGTRSWKSVFVGSVVVALTSLIWMGVLVYALGVVMFYKLNVHYLFVQSRPASLLLGADSVSSLFQITRLVVWNGLAVVGWLWAAALLLPSRAHSEYAARNAVFFGIWLIPGLIFQALIHVENPGHTLFSIPAWCLIGGQVLSAAAERLPISWKRFRPIGVLVAIPLIINVAFFFRLTPSLPLSGVFWDAARLAALRTSIVQLRDGDNMDRMTLQEIRDFSASGVSSVVVAQDVHEDGAEWSLNWRKARYYLPEHDFWVIANQLTPPQAWFARRDKKSNIRTGTSVSVPIPAPGRIVWLIERNGRLHQSLQKTVKLHEGRKVFYSDVASDAAPFEIADFVFVPTNQ